MTDAYALDAQRPRLESDTVLALVREQYGLTGRSRALPSERDQNFHFTDDTGAEFVVKVSGSAEPQDVLDLQNRALLWLADCGDDLPVPRLVRTTAGAEMHPVEVNGRTHWMRVLTYLPGSVLAKARPRDQKLLREVGRRLGQLDNALEGFTHHGASRELYWDLTRAREVIERTGAAIDAPEQRAVIDAVMAQWDRNVVPVLGELRRRVIYNDANDYNVIVGPPGSEGRLVTGFVDFGDMLESAVVCDPAIAAAYALLGTAHPVAAAASVVGGYHETAPLTEQELAVLPTLIAARLVVSVCVSARRRAEEPGNDYLTISERPAWEALERLVAVPVRLQIALLRDACNLEPVAESPDVARWLDQHAEEIAAVLEPDPRTVSTVVLDLSVGSLDLADPQAITGKEAFTDLVFERMRESGASIGIGRYDEPRLLYAEDAFDASLSGNADRRTIHLGVDLFAEPGTPVRAPLDARVHSLRDNGGHLDYGPTVILEHAPEGAPAFYTLYGHLAPDCLTRLRVGEIVAAGETFASIGPFERNGHWPPHLHLQLVTDALERRGEFPGVAPPSERAVWRSLSPNPNLLLRLPESVRAPMEDDAPLLEARERSLGPSLSLAYDEPLHIVRGRGQYLFDVAGRRYLDCVNNVCHVGHCHPRVVQAIQRQAAVLNTNTRYLHEEVLGLADRLCETMPDPLRVCFFVCSGSEANELALRIARAHTGREDLIVLEGGYHGNTAALVDASPYKFDGPGGAGARGHVHTVVMPDDYRGPYRRDDPECGAKYAAHVAEALAGIQESGREPAVFLAESLLGCGGQIELPPGYLAQAYAHARAAGAVCIADEVQVGFGRVGTHFWGFETQGVVPDIVTLGKPIGNGHPLAAVVTTPELAASFDTGMEYFNTFGGNPVSCHVGLAVLDVIRDEGLQKHALEVGQYLRARLETLAADHPMVGDVRGRGLFLGVELVADRDDRTPAPGAARYVVERMKERGILLSTDGPEENVLKIKPPLVFDVADADRLVEALDEVVRHDAAVGAATSSLW